MSIELVTFGVTGISPLLMHNPAGMGASGGDGPIKGPKKIPNPQEEADAAAYKDAKGNLYMPAPAFRRSLWGAGTSKKIGKMTARVAISAGVFSLEKECPLFHPKTAKPLREYAINLSRVCLKSGGKTVAIMRGRAEVAEWMAKVTFEIDTDFITPEQVLQLFSLAGRMVGVGDWRPACTGSFGRYKVEIVK
jgi:hypothetical protein